MNCPSNTTLQIVLAFLSIGCYTLLTTKEEERAIKAIQADVDSIKNRTEQIDANVISLSVKVDKRFVALEGRMTALEQRFATLEEKIVQRFTALESKVDQIFQILTRLSDR